MTDDRLRVERSGDRLRLTLDRPDGRNALDAALLDALHRALDGAEADPDCRVVVLAGRPGTFCDGMDLAESVAGDAPSDRDGARFYDLLRRLTLVPRLVVSVVDGRASGGGVGLAAASDVVLATDRAEFGLPEALWGLLPCSVLPFLVRRTGFQPAYAMMLTTQPLDLDAALRCRLVDQRDPDGRILARLCARVSRVDPSALGAAKRYAGRLHDGPDDTRALATSEFSRLLAQPAVRARIREFVDTGRFPWER